MNFFIIKKYMFCAFVNIISLFLNDDNELK